MKENVFLKLSEQYESELESVVSAIPGSHRQRSTIHILEQTFLEKSGQTVTWSTAVALRFKIVRYDQETSKKGVGIIGAAMRESTVVATGESRFSVVWQHQVSTTGRVIKPKINELLFVENVFDNVIRE